MSFELKRNDRRPRFKVQLVHYNVPVDITTATAVLFSMRTGSTMKVTKQPMAVIDAVAGIVQYAWGATDTSLAGDFNAEVEVNWGTVLEPELQTFPSNGFFVIKIFEDLP